MQSDITDHATVASSVPEPAATRPASSRTIRAHLTLTGLCWLACIYLALQLTPKVGPSQNFHKHANNSSINLPSTNMGTPLPPNEPGDTCSVCWGPDKPFGDGVTPHVLTVNFKMLQQGQFWDPTKEQTLLAPHLLIQGPSACSWSLQSADWLVSVTFSPTEVDVSLRILPSGSFAFRQRLALPCLYRYFNSFTAPAGLVAFGGLADLSWDLEGLGTEPPPPPPT